MSQTFIAGFVIILVQVLNWLGVEVGSDALTTTVTTIVTLGSALWMLYRRTTLQEAPSGIGDVNAFGAKR